ncbi:MAG: site-specific integrase [Dehalococcoidia bacterium]|nr:site-specific integrase [Dehalococcoidia bacterium]
MARRGKGEGSVRERPDGRWEARLTVDGRPRSFFGTTQREALAKMRDAQRRIEKHLPVPSERLTTAAYLESWLSGKRATLTPESARRYEGRLARLLPYIGTLKLAKLQPADLRKAYAAIGAEVSSTTVQLSHGVLHTALKDAEREGLAARNVAGLVTPPRRDTKEYRSLRPDDARALLGAAKGEPLEAFYTLAITTGLRLGELQALQWGDVDMDRRRLQVRRTLAVDGKPVFSATTAKKNHNRTVWLSDGAATALEAHRGRQERQRLDAADAWTEHGLVFTIGTGNPLDGRNLRGRAFPRLLAKAGLPAMRIHDLRHSAASMLLADGVPVKVVSEMLGHADVSTTLRIYAHVLEGAQEQAASYMDRLFHA